VLALFRTYKYYYVSALLIILLGLVSLLLLDKGELVLDLNAQHTPILDKIFSWATHGGEALGGGIVLVLLLLFTNKRNVIVFGGAILLALIFSQGLKHFVFNNEGRPSSVYENLEPIDGLIRHKNNSFPSGHTTAAFTFFTVLAVGFKTKWAQVTASILAAVVGFSRVYLGQHYLNDIVAGAVLGLILTSITILILDKYWPAKVE
jgi:membrane-associated phospholipid phosphatase